MIAEPVGCRRSRTGDVHMAGLTVTPVPGIGEVVPGDDVATVIASALTAAGIPLADRDIVVVTHKIVSKAEGRIVELDDDGPDAHRHLIEQEASDIIRRRGPLVIARTRHGFICANAGVDRSNAGHARAILLPIDPDLSANRIRLKLAHLLGVDVAVIVSDTFGRVWRRGLTDVAIGVAGMEPVTDLRGSTDAYGKLLEVSEVAHRRRGRRRCRPRDGKSVADSGGDRAGCRLSARDGRGRVTMVRPAHEDLFL
jgi:coenzyme F420-0:L-glutamate ligase / coenzyme F420-1:gamma-L-glutamate ligase